MSEPKRYMQQKVLGKKLRLLRERLQETIAETSGAVEIEPNLLEQIEKGHQRPSEDILLLLLTHFDAQEDEAVNLWELAGYEGLEDSADDNPAAKSVYMLIAPDNRVMYTDIVDISTSKHGVVLNFMQSQGIDKPQTVSRVGMSREHAQNVITNLQRALDQTTQTPKALPAPKDSKNYRLEK